MTVRVTREAEPQIELYGAYSGELVGGGKRTLTFTPTGTYLTMVVKNSLSKVQVEQGGFKTSYIPTTGASATRAADVASIDVDQFGYNQAAGTMVVEFSSSGSDGLDYPQAASLNGAAATDVLRMGFNQSNLIQFVSSTTAGGNQAVLNNGTYTQGDVITISAGFRQDDFVSSVDGASVVTDTAGDMVSPITDMTVGRWKTGNYVNGHIKSIQYYPRRLTNAQLQELTT